MVDETDDDPIESTIETGLEVDLDPVREISAVLEDLEAMLKNGEVIGMLSEKGINASLALLAIDGLRHYLERKKEQAADDFATAAEEIRGRLLASSSEDAGPPGRSA